MSEKEKTLISIDELIERAKNLGVDFGKGNPRNRLRYYVKVGLLPHAKKKVFGKKIPEGAYPEDILERLVEIDRMIKSGKGILQIKKELENNEASKKPNALFQGTLKKLVLRTVSLFFVVFLIFYFLVERANLGELISYFLASIVKNYENLAQAILQSEARENNFQFPGLESYLTINAQTLLKGTLDVRDNILANAFVIKSQDYTATLMTSHLSADRIYTFPDQSGVVCLSTGNCVGLAGEVFSSGGNENRLAKFISSNRIGNSSILDFFSDVLITISREGNVGIGIENPQYALHVRGKIQATGDICTDLAGGKCLSQLLPPSPPVIIGGGGIGGSGTPNFIPVWLNSNNLGNSLLSQIGSTLTLTGNMNIGGLLTTDALRIATTTQPGYFLISADNQGNIIFAPFPTGTIPVGTKLLRASLPIFKYPHPAQTATTTFVEVSIKVSTSSLANVLPPQIPGTQRKFALLLKFADDIPTNASSTFRIDFDTLTDFDFEFQGQNLSSLETGVLHLKDDILNLINDNWVLKTKVPSSSYNLRIFSIFLLSYDQIL